MKEVIAVVRMNKMNQTKKALTDAGIAAFFAQGMLLNVFASMGLTDDSSEPWATRLLDACKQIP